MADIIQGQDLLTFVLNAIRMQQDGTLSNLPENPPATTASGPITPEEMAKLRSMINYLENFFVVPQPGDNPA